jgi:hypothetical protein
MMNRFFHGGQPGLEVGDLILPPSETGVQTWPDLLAELDPEGLRVSGQSARPRDWIHMGILRAASTHAAWWTLCPFTEGAGAVYEVKAAGEVIADPTCPGAGWMARSAAIVRVVEPALPRAAALRIPPPGSAAPGVVTPTWAEQERYFARLARARAEGRQLTKGDHADRILGDRLAMMAHGNPSPETLRLLGLS